MNHRIFPTLLSVALLGLAVLATPAAADNGCVIAHNLIHCPIGDAQLQAPPNGSRLFVTNLGSDGKDGVATEFDTATHWRARIKVGDPAKTLDFRALLDGDVTAASSFRLEPDTNPWKSTLELITAFTGAKGHHHYKMIVLDDGQEVATVSDLDENSIITIGRIPPPEPIPPPGPWPWPDFRRYPSGACGWEYTFSDDRTFTMSDGSEATGDTILLIEDVAEGHYLYQGFTAITIQSDAGSLAITGEEISN